MAEKCAITSISNAVVSFPIFVVAELSLCERQLLEIVASISQMNTVYSLGTH